jgi:hypothetical protein
VEYRHKNELTFLALAAPLLDEQSIKFRSDTCAPIRYACTATNNEIFLKQNAN